jgi:hypothetical protein
MTLSGLRAMAARIADYYHKNGYFLAQAYLPAQDIQGGVVTIAVIDGQYGKVTLNNQSRVSDGLANNLLGGLNAGDAITSAALENRLLLLSDLPGVKVSSTLLPGASPGASDLVVNLTPGERISGSVDADNAGNRYTGQYRLGATVNWNEPTGLGDVASLRVLTAGAGLNYARGSYQLHAGKATVGVAYSYLHYALGREFDSLDAHGVEILWIDYDTALSMHRVIPGKAEEQRATRLATPTPLDNRITYGCINVPVAFYTRVVSPSFKKTNGVVYVLPEVRAIQTVFALYDVDERTRLQAMDKAIAAQATDTGAH